MLQPLSPIVIFECALGALCHFPPQKLGPVYFSILNRLTKKGNEVFDLNSRTSEV